MHECLDRFEAGLRAGACRVRSLMQAYRNNYGVLINAKDAGDDSLARAASKADDALEDLVCYCHRAMRRYRGDVQRATMACATEYQRIRDVVRY